MAAKTKNSNRTLLSRIVLIFSTSLLFSVAVSIVISAFVLPRIFSDLVFRVAKFQTDLALTTISERINNADWFNINRDLTNLNNSSNKLIQIHLFNQNDQRFIPSLPPDLNAQPLRTEIQNCLGEQRICNQAVRLQDSANRRYLAYFAFHRGFANDRMAVISILDNGIFERENDWILSLVCGLGALFLFSQSLIFIGFMERGILRPIKNILKFLEKDCVQSLKVNSLADNREILVLETKIIDYFEAMQVEQARNIKLERESVIAQVASHLAHDLRAPLGTFEQLLVTPDREIPNKKPAIKDALHRLYSMIESIRYAEVENLIRRNPAFLSFDYGSDGLRIKALERNIRLSLPAPLSEAVSIDLPKVERAWVNLASNAIDVAKSYVNVEVEILEDRLLIRVVDDGPGVPDEFLPKLFQRGATHGKPDGTGLGLAYVRQIMRGHGGDVTYQRDNGLTIFECRLPNAVMPKGENSLKNQLADSTLGKVQDKKVVAVLFKPDSLNRSLLGILGSQKSKNFEFSCEFDNADVVATNDPDVALDAIEDGKEPLEFSSSLQEAAIVDRLKRRFHLV